MTEIETRRIPGPPELCIDIAGNAGEVVLFLHGIGGNRTNWRDQLLALAPQYTAVAWDARGYGESADYEGDLRMEDFAADILRVLDAMGAERAHLVGLSMGGMLVQDFYARHPERVRSLALCDTSRGPRTEHSDAWVEEFLALRRAPLLAGKTPAEIAPKVAESLLGSRATEEMRARLVASLSALHPESYLKTLETVTRYHPILTLAEVAVPTLVIVGEDDRLTPPHASEVLARGIPGARLEVLPGAGHLSNIEAPVAFNAALLGFLRAI